MKKYKISWKDTYLFETVIEAEDYEDALELAGQMKESYPSLMSRDVWEYDEEDECINDFEKEFLISNCDPTVTAEFDHSYDLSCVPWHCCCDCDGECDDDKIDVEEEGSNLSEELKDLKKMLNTKGDKN